jgi:hypothetical protein
MTEQTTTRRMPYLMPGTELDGKKIRRVEHLRSGQWVYFHGSPVKVYPHPGTVLDH